MSVPAAKMAMHRRAQLACQRKHGDWRYDPGSRWHLLRWWLPARLGAWRA